MTLLQHSYIELPFCLFIRIIKVLFHYAEKETVGYRTRQNTSLTLEYQDRKIVYRIDQTVHPFSWQAASRRNGIRDNHVVILRPSEIARKL